MTKSFDKIIGICPAAGKGNRLAPFPGSKELLPVGFQFHTTTDGFVQYSPKAVSQYLIDSMIQTEVSHIFIVLGPGKSDIMEFYGNGSRWNTQISYLFQERLNGMPFALDLAYDLVQNSLTIFGMPDTIFEPANAFNILVERHQREQADLTLGLFPTTRPQKFGMVKLDDDDSFVYCIDKPQKTDLKYLWGIACWSPSFSQFMHIYLQQYSQHQLTQEVVLSAVFQEAVKANLKIKGHRFDKGLYLDVGTADDLSIAMRYVLENYPNPGKSS